jgi:hypothetical protein
MVGRIEISPVLTKFVQAIASDANTQGAAQELTDILKKARVSELVQSGVKRVSDGLKVYIATNNGREVTTSIKTVGEKYKVVNDALDKFVENYNKRILWF